MASVLIRVKVQCDNYALFGNPPFQLVKKIKGERRSYKGAIGWMKQTEAWDMVKGHVTERRQS